MDRKEVIYFIGTEVEHTPVYGEKTLFVAGPQDGDEIVSNALKHNCKHIYFGANQSFPLHKIDITEVIKWKQMILHCLNKGFWCTLDFDICNSSAILEMDLSKYDKFIPIISAKIPNISEYNKNTILKIDDIGFDATNEGVWCHKLNDLKDNTVHTSWDKYTGDISIDE